MKITFTFKINKAYKRFIRSFQSNNWRCVQFPVIHYTTFNYTQLITLLSEQLPYDNNNNNNVVTGRRTSLNAPQKKKLN